MKHMTITVLVDNRTTHPEMETEHGLSILLQAPHRKVLLDTGASSMLLRNAQRLGIELGDVDTVFLSHGHADHAGGLETVLSVNEQAQVIVSSEALSKHFFSVRHYKHTITPHWPLELMEGRTHYITASQQIADDMFVIAQIPQQYPLPLGNGNLFVETVDGRLLPDSFRHEMALYVDGLLFTGCAHNGLQNILAACPYPVHTVIGGFHLLDSHLAEHYETSEELEVLARELMTSYADTCFYTSHCTGDAAFKTLHSVMGNQLKAFSCGMQFSL